MNVCGIDLGSRFVKIIITDKDEIKYTNIIDTSSFYRHYCNNNNGIMNINFDLLGINSKNIDRVISTGYGRNNTKFLNAKSILELNAHVLGAIKQTGIETFTLLDVGGQDTKVVLVKNKKVMDINLNDKCAASCGRYLENMASVLGIELGEMIKYHENPIELSSTCAIFGESELIGKISEGNDVKYLAAGVNYSLFKRISPMMERFLQDVLIVTGGVAQNKALIEFIQIETEFKQVIIPKEPQLNGAIGCGMYGLMNWADT